MVRTMNADNTYTIAEIQAQVDSFRTLIHELSAKTPSANPAISHHGNALAFALKFASDPSKENATDLAFHDLDGGRVFLATAESISNSLTEDLEIDVAKHVGEGDFALLCAFVITRAK